MSAGCRISRVRPKGRGLAEVVIMRSPNERRRDIFLAWAKRLVDDHLEAHSIAGFAVVVWDREAYATYVSKSYDVGHIALMDENLPDFVRSKLRSYLVKDRAAQMMDRDNTPPLGEGA